METVFELSDVEQSLAELDQQLYSGERVDQRLAEYGDYIGVPGLALGDDGSVGLDIDDELTLYFVARDQFNGVIALVELDRDLVEQERVLETLLKANLDLSASGGGLFARLPETGELVFMQAIAFFDDDLARIDDAVSRFVDLAQRWTLELALQPEPGETDDPDERAVEATGNVINFALRPGSLRA